MKKLTIALGLSAVMAVGFSACDTYDIYPEQYGKVMSIKNAGDRDITVFTTDPTASDTIIVMKGGHMPEAASTVSLRAMTDADWAAYIEETRNEGLIRITPECYSFAADKDVQEEVINFNGSDDRYTVKRFYVKSPELAKWYQDNAEAIEVNGKIPVIPVMLAAVGAGDSVSVDNNYVFYHPNLTTPTLNFSAQGPVVSVLNLDDCGEGKYLDVNATIDLPSQLLWDFKVTTLFAAAALDKWKESHDDAADCVVMDKSWFDYNTDAYPYIESDATKTRTTYQFTKGGSKQLNLGIRVDLSKFNPLTDMNTSFVVPLRLLKPVAFNDLTEEEANAIGLACQTDTIFVGFRVEKVYKLHELAIDETMTTSNCGEQSEGSIAGLFDDDATTFFHSAWSSNWAMDPEMYGYLQFEIPEDNINMCYFIYQNRTHGNPGYVVDVATWGSNDGETWWKFGETTVNDPNQATSAGIYNVGDAGHPFISLDDDGNAKTFKYLRFSVIKTKTGTMNGSGSVYFNAAEIRVYGGLSD